MKNESEHSSGNILSSVRRPLGMAAAAGLAVTAGFLGSPQHASADGGQSANYKNVALSSQDKEQVDWKKELAMAVLLIPLSVLAVTAGAVGIAATKRIRDEKNRK